MKKENKKILAINPGSRYLGLAVFNGTELREWMIKTLQNKSVQERLDSAEKIVLDLIELYEVDTLIIKKLHSFRSSKNLQKLTDVIKRIAKAKNLLVREYSISQLKQLLIPTSKSNKKSLMEEMTSQYPFLFKELEKEKRNRNKYFIRMFEAVALGTVGVDQ